MVTDEDVAKKYVALLHSATHRNIPFSLRLSDVRKLLNKKRCVYTGNEFSEDPLSPMYKSIDRIDNSLGYVPGNVAACTKEFNSLKGSLTVNDIVSMYKVVVRGVF